MDLYVKLCPGFDPVPSQAPEGPADVGDIVGEEIARIRRALGVLLRQLQKNPLHQHRRTESKAQQWPTWEFNKKFDTIPRVQFEDCETVVCPTA